MEKCGYGSHVRHLMLEPVVCWCTIGDCWSEADVWRQCCRWVGDIACRVTEATLKTQPQPSCCSGYSEWNCVSYHSFIVVILSSELTARQLFYQVCLTQLLVPTPIHLEGTFGYDAVGWAKCLIFQKLLIVFVTENLCCHCSTSS